LETPHNREMIYICSRVGFIGVEWRVIRGMEMYAWWGNSESVIMVLLRCHMCGFLSEVVLAGVKFLSLVDFQLEKYIVLS